VGLLFVIKVFLSKIYKGQKVDSKLSNSPINKCANKLDSSQKKKYKWPITTGRNVHLF
jgi:hypothetical protein